MDKQIEFYSSLNEWMATSTTEAEIETVQECIEAIFAWWHKFGKN